MPYVYNESISGNVLKRIEILCLHEHLYINIYKSIIYNISTWNNQSVHWWMSEIPKYSTVHLYVYVIEYVSHMRRDGVEAHAKT